MGAAMGVAWGKTEIGQSSYLDHLPKYFWRESIDGWDIAAGGSGQFEVSSTPKTVADHLTSHRVGNFKQVP